MKTINLRWIYPHYRHDEFVEVSDEVWEAMRLSLIHISFSAICPIKFLQSAFVGAMEKNNIAPEYIEGMLNITSVPMLVVIVAVGLVGGLIGGFIGQKALKKHFIKAGLVSVK